MSHSSTGLLEIDLANNRLRRLTALPENPSEFETTLKQNTVYVKGFPADAQTSLDDLMVFFEQFGKVLQVFMRRFPATKAFKGSVFVTFGSNEETLKFMELTEVRFSLVLFIVL